MMFSGKRSDQLAAAEEAYAEAEMARVKLVCERNRLDGLEYKRALSAAWLRSMDALEMLITLKNAETAALLQEAAEKAASS